MPRLSAEDQEWKARRVEIEKQAAEAQALKKRKRAEAALKSRAEVKSCPPIKLALQGLKVRSAEGQCRIACGCKIN